MRLFLTQLKCELHKLFSRPRTHLGFLAFVVFELILLLLMQRADVRELIRKWIEKVGYTFPENFTGPTVANFVLGYTLTTLGAFFLALVGGDIVSKEIEDGTMRMVLARSVPRWRVLLLKLITCLVYTATLTIFIALTSLGFGLAFEGTGNLLVINVDEKTAVAYHFGDGLMVYFFGALPLLTLSMLSISAFAFTLSCFNIKPAAATIGALSVFIGDQLLRDIPFFVNLRPWFLTTRVISWVHIYDQRVPWGQLINNYSTLAVLDVLTVAVGWWHFNHRDIKP